MAADRRESNPGLSSVTTHIHSLLSLLSPCGGPGHVSTATMAAPLPCTMPAWARISSHDPRAPLRHVSGFTGMLLQSPSIAKDDQARRLASHVEEVREELHDVIGSRHIEWRIAPLPEVVGDPAMLRQAVFNLLHNAVKYTRTRATALIEIGAREEGQETVVFMRDNGVGFDINYVGKLFGVFARLHSDEEFEGTGIGLANVRRIISRLGGRTWAEGRVDEGATIYFSLPREDRQP